MRPHLVGLVVLFCTSCWSGKYLAQQGLGQLRLLQARRPIADVLADASVSDETKRRLELALQARAFGIATIGLRGGAGFTRFVDSHGAPIAWNVTAAPKCELRPHLNNFPIVGAVPYLGFFREKDVRKEEARLAAMGLDTYVREVAGYSTLGFIADPIYSSMIEGSDARIVEVVLHEMTHATVFLPGHADWNESMATLVGIRGAAAFFRARGEAAQADAVLAEAERRERDQEQFAEFLEPIAKELEALYAEPISCADKLSRREPIFARARQEYLRRWHPGPFVAGPLNNAVIVAFTTYHRATPEHVRILNSLGGDLRALIRLYKHAVEDEADPLAYLRAFWG